MKKTIMALFVLAILMMSVSVVMAATCPSGTTPTPVETVTVPSDGSSVTSTNTLDNGVTYLLEASGTYRFANWGVYGIADAEWAYRRAPYYPTDTSYEDVVPDEGSTTSGWVKGEDYYASECGLDVQVSGSCVDWGDYNDAHDYVSEYTGDGNLVSFHIHDSAYGDNSGSLTIDIDKCVDITAPVVTINSPADGDFVSGTVDIFGTIVEDYELSHYNIAIYPGDADFNDFSKRLEQETVYQSSGFGNELIYSWDTTTHLNGEYLIRLAARDKAGNRDLSGSPYLGGDDSQHVIKVIVEHTKADILQSNGVPGKGIANAPGLQKVPKNDNFAKGTANKKNK